MVQEAPARFQQQCRSSRVGVQVHLYATVRVCIYTSPCHCQSPRACMSLGTNESPGYVQHLQHASASICTSSRTCQSPCMGISLGTNQSPCGCHYVPIRVPVYVTLYPLGSLCVHITAHLPEPPHTLVTRHLSVSQTGFGCAGIGC